MTSNVIIKEDLQIIYESNVDWSKFYNKTILITGANGFLPAYIVESLLYLNVIDPNNNVKVIALVRNIENAKRRFIEYLNDENLEFLQQDVSDPIKIEGKVDYIIHAASQASPKFYGTDPVGTLKANVLGTINLLDFARIKQIKSFLYFSSGEVYGEIKTDEIHLEENTFGYLNPVNVRSCYAESKRMGENICVSYFHQYNVPTKIVRPFHTYGPKMKLDDGRVYADFVSNILSDKDICMKSDGSAIRAFCYLTDATIGFFMTLLEGNNGEAYNLGNSSEEYSILNLAEILINLYPEKNLKVIREFSENNNNYLKSPLIRNSPDINKIKKLGWFPVVSVEKGFKRTIESYKS